MRINPLPGGLGKETVIATEMNMKASRSAAWNGLSIAVTAAGVVTLAAAAVLIALSFTGALDDGSTYSGPGTVTGFNRLDIGSLQAAQPTATPAPVAPSDAPIAKMLIPSIGVDAPISVKGVGADGVMEAPDGPWDISWYDFSARPGFGSNAVFSGHVDYINIGPAVFWRLKDLVPDDLIEVRLQDGTAYRYSVVAMDSVDAATADVGNIVGATDQEVVTLISCIGTFDPNTGQYDQRLVVRALRVAAVAAEEPPLSLDDGHLQTAAAPRSHLTTRDA
jgi:sortase (surface protein transpeptidase)